MYDQKYCGTPMVKAQEMTIGEGKTLEKDVLHFSTSPTRNTIVGLEYVMTGRVKSLADFAIGNKFHHT